ncbi:MAG: DUF3142 domain-containing protein [Alphaproteobacteria bacterium]|nr:DUF3142 domain-containing protein [Alphaproteobacteria bacterium]
MLTAPAKLARSECHPILRLCHMIYSVHLVTLGKGHIRIFHFAIQLFALLVVLSASSSVRASENDGVNAYWIWGSIIPEKARLARNLYVYQGVFDAVRSRDVYRFEGLSPRRIDDFEGNLILTYRLDQLVPPEMVVSRYIAHRQAWKRNGIRVDGLQIDYDSPTAKLKEYASWLVVLKNTVGDSVPVSITGLGDWLASAPPSHLNDLSQKVSFVAFMMYHGGRPLQRLNRYTARLARLTLPFKLGRLNTQQNDKMFESVFQAPGYQGEIVFMLSGGAQE